MFEQVPAEFRTTEEWFEVFFLTDNETFHLKMVSAGLRIAPSGSDVNLCLCDKSSVSYVLQVLERSSCQIHEGVKIVKC